MEDLNTIKSQLKERLPKENIMPILKVLKKLLPEHSPKRNSFLQLEADYKALKMQLVNGVLAHQDHSLAESRIRMRLIEFIDSLEVDDFNINLRRSHLREDNKIKQGHVLYRIPHQMQVQKEVKCIVRIALNEVTLVKKFEVDEHTKIESEVRVSDHMKVLLIDPAASPVFAIRTTSEPIQFIDEDAATEWKFYITPLLPGEHILELKVVVIEIINGVERVQENSLEESVVVVAEAMPEEVTYSEQSANIDFVTSVTFYTFEKNVSGFHLLRVKYIAPLLIPVIVFSASLIIIFSIQGVKDLFWPSKPLKPTTSIEFKETFYDFGTVPEGDTVLYRYKFKNTGKEILIIEDVRGNCGCILPRRPTKAIAPGEEADIIIEFNTQGRIGVNNKTVTVIANTNPPQTFLSLHGIVERDSSTLEPPTPEELRIDTNPDPPTKSEEPKDSPVQRDIFPNNNIEENKQDSLSKYLKIIQDNMVLVEGGTFTMGCNDGRDKDCEKDEKPPHSVNISKYYISKYEVTFGEYDAFCDATKRQKPDDRDWGRGKRPVINVSWEDAVAYCNWLSQNTKENYRLPTEAEWEYAAKGGVMKKGLLYAGSRRWEDVAVYMGDRTDRIGTKLHNELGLYDMSGNVWEWVKDCYHSHYEHAPNDGTAWEEENCLKRVLRGGSWYRYDKRPRVSNRDKASPTEHRTTCGFRIARSY
ncbi:MAG: SUMF1/EgtB/PvdO family nonheme iron enzyme [Saprospiraceae bacterium]